MMDPHGNESVLQSGKTLRSAAGALILLHGRGGSGEDMLSLAGELALAGVTMLAPQAADHSWYPNSFLAPVVSNQPWLDSALHVVEGLLERCLSAGLPSKRVALLGFSQGACLACEFVARHPRRYAGLVAFTGGLIGPLGSNLHHPGSLEQTPVLLSSGDPDPHVPWMRVEETVEQFRKMSASVQLKGYSGRPHTVLPEEIANARNLLAPAIANITI